MSSKHTPDPWKIDHDEDGLRIVASNGQVIATVEFPMDRAKGYDWGVAEQEANAKLIVEAPARARLAYWNGVRAGAKSKGLDGCLASIAEVAEKMAEALVDARGTVLYSFEPGSNEMRKIDAALSDYRLAVKGKAGE